MKKIPLVLIPASAFAVVFIIFATMVPENGDLISPAGDMILGEIIGIAFIICLIIDARNFVKRKNQ